MKIKKYVANTMPEAMKKIRHDLGPDAVILNSKEIRQGGFLGLFKKKKIEVIAALDNQPLNEPSTHEERIENITPILQEHSLETNVLDELKEIKQMMALQMPKQEYEPEFEVVYQHLLQQEVEHDVAKQLMDPVVKKFEHTPDPAIRDIYQAVKEEIEKRLSGLTRQGAGMRIIQFVGPTGVGKTTTLAKIAAHSMLKEQKKVAFITADTYRIAAIEQLKTYARILDVPIEVAYSIQDFNQLVMKFAHYDLILVDTAGRNYRDPKYVKQLFSQLNQDMKTYIVLSLTAKPKDIMDIYQQFDHIPNKEVIFTKVDETRQYGSMLNIALTHHIPIAYITNGQNVPDDIVIPSSQQISDLIIGRDLFHDT